MFRLPSCIVLTLAFFLIACGGAGSGSGGDSGNGDLPVQGFLVRWQASADVAGYVIHWGTSSGVYIDALDIGDPGPGENGVVSFVLPDIGASGMIFFAMTSYDEHGQMSRFSNELAVVVP